MNEWLCLECGRRREYGENILTAICPCCVVEMKKTKKVEENDGQRR